MNAYWLSWWHHSHQGEFEIHSPWWKTGYRDGADGKTECSICCAVMANNLEEAWEYIYSSYDKRPEALDVRFEE